MFLNLLITLIILSVITLICLIYLKKISSEVQSESLEHKFEIEYLLAGIKEIFNGLLKINLMEMNLTKSELEKRIKNKNLLRRSLRNCAYGDYQSKCYVKEYIKDILTGSFYVNPHTISEIIPFSNMNKLTAQDKFDIILYQYTKQYGLDGLKHMLLENGFHKEKINNTGQHYYELTSDDIHSFYETYSNSLDFQDKLEIVTQRLYQLYKGYGVIDLIRDQRIDGVSGGVSGIPVGFYQDSQESFNKETTYSYESIWIFFSGTMIHLSCLTFGSQSELERVCKNIYRYHSSGQLSESEGYKVNEMYDGSRVVVARPPFCESWVFFVRKFDSATSKSLEALLTDDGAEYAILVLRWLVEGCRVIAVTGAQGTGKTTLLMALIGFIKPVFTLRIQEMAFELHLRRLYPKRNIVTFKETDTITGQEGLDLQKKTDGVVNILGEVANAEVSSWLVQMAQVASLFTMFTHHAKTTKDLVISLRNSLLQQGNFSDEIIAQEQVADVIDFDVHMVNINGHRFIERITEIIRTNQKESIFETKNIVEYRQGRYVICRLPSKKALSEMERGMNEMELKRFKKEIEEVNLLFEV